jgi:hypothetical protein
MFGLVLHAPVNADRTRHGRRSQQFSFLYNGVEQVAKVRLAEAPDQK